MPPTGMVVQQIQGVTVVNFRDVSILDTAAVEAIAKELYSLVDQQAQQKIVLDYTKVRFLSSTMIGVLLNVYKKSQSIKGKVVICGLRKELHKVFEIMKLDKMLTFAEDEHKALAALDVFPQS
jgi:anti-anti-sigma factor